MALVKAKVAVEETPINYIDPIASRIQQRRYQILVHSLLYYACDISLVSDHQWQAWAQDLVRLQNENPSIASRVIFADAFKGFDGSTGYHLPYGDEQVVKIAYRLLKSDDSAESEHALNQLQSGVCRTPSEYEKYRKKAHSAPASTLAEKEVKPVEKKPRKGLFSVSRK